MINEKKKENLILFLKSFKNGVHNMLHISLVLPEGHINKYTQDYLSVHPFCKYSLVSKRYRLTLGLAKQVLCTY